MSKDNKPDHDDEIEELQLALVRAQAAAIAGGDRTVLVMEGRDGAGKDGTIKRIVEHLSPRVTRVVALPKPSDRERTQWFFQRYVAHLPAAGELVIFNRSWYNRAGVEVVMGFSTPAEQAEFLRDAPDFERMLVESGITLVKVWLDISKEEQAERLEARREDPLKQLKVSDLDAVAQAKWSDYSAARDAMLARTHTALAPWVCVRADKKPRARGGAAPPAASLRPGGGGGRRADAGPGRAVRVRGGGERGRAAGGIVLPRRREPRVTEGNIRGFGFPPSRERGLHPRAAVSSC